MMFILILFSYYSTSLEYHFLFIFWNLNFYFIVFFVQFSSYLFIPLFFFLLLLLFPFSQHNCTSCIVFFVISTTSIIISFYIYFFVIIYWLLFNYFFSVFISYIHRMSELTICLCCATSLSFWDEYIFFSSLCLNISQVFFCCKSIPINYVPLE